MQQAREAARRSACKNNLKQLGLALHNYHDVHKLFPPGWIAVKNGMQSPHDGGSGAGWALMLLPHIEQTNLWETFDSNVSIADPANAQLRSINIEVYNCPSDTKPQHFELAPAGHSHGARPSAAQQQATIELPTANYVAVFGTEPLDGCELPPGQGLVTPRGQCKGDGLFFHNSRTKISDIHDGTSNTLAVGERRTDPERGWYSTWVGMVPGGEEAFQRIEGSADHLPNSAAAHFDDFSSRHTGGAQFLFADGHVRFISEVMDEGVYQGLATISGGEYFDGSF